MPLGALAKSIAIKRDVKMEFTSTDLQECLVPKPESLVPMVIIEVLETEAENDQAGSKMEVKQKSALTPKDDKFSDENETSEQSRGSEEKGEPISIGKTDSKLSFMVVEGRKTYYCPHCLYNSTGCKDMKRHLMTHTGQEFPIAEEKGESGSSGEKGSQLTFLVVEGRKTYYCPHCQYRTSRGSDLKRHLMTHTGARPHKCTLCSFSCSQAHHLRQHVLIHSGKKPLHCTECSFGCIKVDDLKRHMFIHTGQCLHQCSVCSYSCSRAGSLKKHMMSHNRDRPHRCSICSFSSSQLGHLKEHLYTHTGQKPYVCPVCSYRCCTSGNLSSHIKRHTKERPYRCTSCSYRSAQVSNLKRHVTKKHP